MAENRDPPLKWRKANQEELFGAEQLLKARESYCVAACARFLRLKENRDHLWALGKTPGGGRLAGIVIQNKRSLFPVFDHAGQIPAPPFMRSLLRQIPIRAIQGLKKDAALLESVMAGLGILPVQDIDYDLMALDREPSPESFNAGPPELLLRRPGLSDMEGLYRLQAAYEQEEVLPRGAVFNPRACLLSLENILAREYILTAELKGRLVGKINTSASSFSRYQIGGVYVAPDCRGLGIACRMGAVFTRELIRAGKGLSLFVKKRNSPAQAVYRRIGFEFLEDYRICYY